jgi:hypothetical protein
VDFCGCKYIFLGRGGVDFCDSGNPMTHLSPTVHPLVRYGRICPICRTETGERVSHLTGSG